MIYAIALGFFLHRLHFQCRKMNATMLKMWQILQKKCIFYFFWCKNMHDLWTKILQNLHRMKKMVFSDILFHCWCCIACEKTWMYAKNSKFPSSIPLEWAWICMQQFDNNGCLFLYPLKVQPFSKNCEFFTSFSNGESPSWFNEWFL